MKEALLILAVLIIVGIAIYTFIPPTTQTSVDTVKKFASYEELKSFLKSNMESYAGYYGGTFGALSSTAGTAVMQTTTAMKESVAPTAAPLTDGGGAGEYSTTNIQVEGVDEADIVKNDGKYIYTVTGKKVIIVDAYPAESSKIISQIELNGTVQEIFVNKDKLVVFGWEYSYDYSSEVTSEIGIVPPSYSRPKTFVKIYDITDRSNPVLKRDVTVDGNYYDSRMIGNYVYTIVNEPVYYGGYYGGGSDVVPLPIITSNNIAKTVAASDIYYFDYPDYSYVFTNIVAINTQDDNEDLSSKTFLTSYSQNMFVSQTNIYYVYTKRANMYDFYDKIIDEVVIPAVPAEEQKKMNDVKNMNISKSEKVQQIIVIFQNYMRTLNPEESAKLMNVTQQKMEKVQADIAKEMEKTIIHKISVDNGKIDYKTSGEVPGYPLNQFSMDEYNNNFRIATTTDSWRSTGSLNHVYILDSNLKITGKLEDLAHGERIYSVRLLGNKGYMVTFRQVDPLFVIDLSDPNNPRVLGFLKIPGVSDYLHPYDENHIIGVGRDASEQGTIKGMKLSLFDVSDVSNPTEISKYIIGERGTTSEALNDHKAFLFSKEKNLLVIPVRLAEGGRYNTWQGAYVFNIDLTNGITLKGKISHAYEKIGSCTGDFCPTWTDGKFGKALSLNGNNEYVSIPNSQSLNMPKQLTISAWVKFDEIQKQPIVTKAEYGNYQYYLGMTSTGAIEFTVNEDDTWKTTDTRLETGQWYHITVTADRNTDAIRIYINGVEDANSPFTAEYPFHRNSNDVRIGAAEEYSYQNLRGTVDDVIIVNRSLSKDEITQLYQNDNDIVMPSDTVLHLKFNEGEGTRVEDSSGFGNSGTVTRGNEYSYYSYDYSKEIRRSLYMDSVLYTISSKIIKMNNLDSLSDINKVELPYDQEEYYPVRGV